MNPPIAQRLFVALDVSEGAVALDLARRLAPAGVSFKIGMQLFYAEGMALVQAVQALCPERPVFVDLKLHDIPNTVAGAAESLVAQGVGFFNVHASGGLAMMAAARQAADRTAERLKRPRPVLIGVTALTSLDEATLQATWQSPVALSDHVLHLAGLARQAGLDGVVCSAREARAIRAACGEDFLAVTPGIRLPGYTGGSDDQVRVLTPDAALQAGATHLVVGRPITQAGDPPAAAEAVLALMNASMNVNQVNPAVAVSADRAGRDDAADAVSRS